MSIFEKCKASVHEAEAGSDGLWSVVVWRVLKPAAKGSVQKPAEIQKLIEIIEKDKANKMLFAEKRV